MAPPSRFLGLAIAALVAVSAGVVACSGDGEEAADTTTTTTIPTPRSQLDAIELVVEKSDVVSATEVLAPMPDNVREDIAEVIDTFMKLTSAGPILTGAPAKGWGVLLTPEALDRAKGPDRAALVEDGVPRMRRLRAEKATVSMVALAIEGRAYQLAVAEVDWLLKGHRGQSSVGIHRTGEITLVPAPEGGWLISSYDLHVSRAVSEPATTSTSSASTGGD